MAGRSPHIRLRILFDKVLFDGGLKARGVGADGGRRRYTIREYSDLSDILGSEWYYRGLNQHGDFCFVILRSVRYYLYKRRPIVDYKPLLDNQEGCKETVHQAGYILAFNFVRGDSTRKDFHQGPSGFIPPD